VQDRTGTYQVSKTLHGVCIGPPQAKYTLWRKRDKWPYLWQRLGTFLSFADAREHVDAEKSH
jgi:hypothetical protein